MDGVQFEEDTYSNFKQANYQTEQDSKMITLLIKSGLAKNKKQANIIMLSAAAIFILASAYTFASTVEKEPEIIPYAEMTQEQKQAIPERERIFLEKMNK